MTHSYPIRYIHNHSCTLANMLTSLAKVVVVVAVWIMSMDHDNKLSMEYQTTAAMEDQRTTAM